MGDEELDTWAKLRLQAQSVWIEWDFFSTFTPNSLAAMGVSFSDPDEVIVFGLGCVKLKEKYRGTATTSIRASIWDCFCFEKN